MSGITKSRGDGVIDPILVISTRGMCGKKHEIISRKGIVSTDGRLVDSELADGKNTGLVGATARVIDKTICMAMGINQEDKDVVQTTAIAAPGIEDENLSNDENPDGDRAESTDLGKNLLQVTGPTRERHDKKRCWHQ